jgi:predicted nucleic acid-binding protein
MMKSSTVSWVVADSGIFLAAALTEEYTLQATSLIEMWQKSSFQIAAPTLFQYEVVAVMRKSVHRGRLTDKDAIYQRDLLLAYPIQYMLDEKLLKRAYEIATLYNRPTAYDSQYLAVAERLQCDFWTTDERLFNSLTGFLSWVKWIGNMK